ncbi:MAG TPA: GIY-YIG nuclease family protein [Verrucomicrobiae bacterium]|nr:GIY-YIG nuclease family protein [Verrucomicrobiae bacterium]
MAYAARASSSIMFYVYLPESEGRPGQRYIGFSANVDERLKAHNAAEPRHTSKFRPWRLVAYFAFENEQKARPFEFYLKFGSGIASASKRFW